MSEHHFETHRPVGLYVEIGRGSVRVVASETTESHVEVTGRDADAVQVEQDGDEISVVAPKRAGFLTGDSRLEVVVTVPADSDLAIRTGSADIALSGTFGTGKLRSGSGDVQVDTFGGPALVDTGSGDIRIVEARDELRIKSGSGDVHIGHATSAVAISTGSGEIELGTVDGPTFVKTGSGSLSVAVAHTDVSMTTGSGDLAVGTITRGRINAKAASGDVRVGIPAGVPVWTDVSTLSGSINSNLAGMGEPRDGADHVELRAKTVSGDIVLAQV